MLVEMLKRYVPTNEQEEKDKQVMLDFIKNQGLVAFTRDSELAHLTASGFVVNQTGDKVLMAYHHIYDSFAWTGGHADGETDLLQVSLNEAREETGIVHVRPLLSEIAGLEVLTVEGHVKKGRYVNAHLHLNVTFLLVGDDTDCLKVKADENSAVSWIAFDDLASVCHEPLMLPIYEKYVKKMNKIL